LKPQTSKVFKLSKLQKFILVQALDGLRTHERLAGMEGKARVIESSDEKALMVLPPEKVSRPSNSRLIRDGDGISLELDIGNIWKDPWNEEVSHFEYKDVLIFWFGLRFAATRKEMLKRSKWDRIWHHDAYKSAMASLVRAATRLEARGLLQKRGWRKHGRHEVIWQITPEGIEVAESFKEDFGPRG
jgi:hypothetical protein